MQGGRGVKIVIFVALQCKVTKNPRKTEDAWGKSFSRPPGGPEEQRTYELRTRLLATPLTLKHPDHTLNVPHYLRDPRHFPRVFSRSDRRRIAETEGISR